MDPSSSDRYRNSGAELVRSTALAAVQRHQELTGRHAEGFARLFAYGVDQLSNTMDNRVKKLEAMPPRLRDPLPTSRKLQYAARKKCAMTAAERDAATARKAEAERRRQTGEEEWEATAARLDEADRLQREVAAAAEPEELVERWRS